MIDYQHNDDELQQLQCVMDDFASWPITLTVFTLCVVQARVLKLVIWRSSFPAGAYHYSHTLNHFMAPFLGLPGWASARRKLLLDFVVQGKITDTPSICLGAIPSGLISDPPLSSPPFYARCPSCRIPPNLSLLGTDTKYAGLHTQWLGYLPLQSYLILWRSFQDIAFAGPIQKDVICSNEVDCGYNNGSLHCRAYCCTGLCIVRNHQFWSAFCFRSMLLFFCNKRTLMLCDVYDAIISAQ